MKCLQKNTPGSSDKIQVSWGCFVDSYFKRYMYCRVSKYLKNIMAFLCIILHSDGLNIFINIVSCYVIQCNKSEILSLVS